MVINHMSTEITLEDIVKEIVVQAGLPRDEVMRRVDEAVTNVNGLLTKVGAALLLADKLKVNLDINGDGNDAAEELTIKYLVAGMKNITISGKVVNIYPVNEFTRKDGRTGKVLNMTIRDGTGSTKVAFWDGKAGEALASIKPGNVIELVNVYSKAAYKGNGVDLNVGNKSDFHVKDDEGGDEYSTLKMTIEDVTDDVKYCTLEATVVKKIEPKEFNRKDGATGEVAKAYVEDDTGKATIVFWTDRIVDHEGIVEGNRYEFSDLSVKYNDFREEFEFHVNKATVISPQ